MSFDSPSHTVRTFVDAMNRGDLDAAMVCYAPHARFVTEPGRILDTPVTIREALAGMLGLRPTLVTDVETVLVTGRIALYHSTWHLSGHAPDDSVVTMGGHSSDVLELQSDGAWKIAIDNPWGAAILADAKR